MIKTPLLWLTDLHLDATDGEIRDAFFQEVLLHPADVVLIGGDTADGPLALVYLGELARRTKKRIYFVLGNHDFYGGSIDIQQQKAIALTKEEHNLCYLTYSDPISLSETTCLCGHDGWADGREGTFLLSAVCLRDYYEIDELKGRNAEELQEVLQDLGDFTAQESEKQILKAFESHDKVIFLTHAPPFRNACLYDGKVTDDLWAPHFVNKAMGDMLMRVMQQFPRKQCLVLAGHSHHFAKVRILPNLEVEVSGSELGQPEPHTLFFD